MLLLTLSGNEYHDFIRMPIDDAPPIVGLGILLINMKYFRSMNIADDSPIVFFLTHYTLFQ